MKWDAVLCICLLLPLVADFSQALVDAKGCNRTVRNSVGWVRWTGRMGRCVVRIRAPLRDPQVIEVRVRRLQVGVLRDARCLGAFVQFSDGIEDLEDDVGRYCGHVTGNATRLFLRKGPELTIVMDSTTTFAAENPVIFSAQYSVLPLRIAMERHRGPLPSAAECSLECSHENHHRKCTISSPGYPGVYPRGIGCTLALESSAGRFRIGGIAEDTFDLMNYTIQDGCRTENCEGYVEADFNSKLRYNNDGPKREAWEKPKIARSLRSIDYRLDEDDEIIIGEDIRQRHQPREDERIAKHHRSKNDRRIQSSSKRKKSGRKNPKGDHTTFGRKLVIAGTDEVILQRDKNSGKRFGEVENESDLKSLDHGSEENSFDINEEVLERSDKPETINPLFDQRFYRRHRYYKRFENSRCVSDYLAIYENIDGTIVEISKFCGEGRFPQIVTRGRKVIVKFFSERDGTIMHDGFQLTLQEIESDKSRHQKNCEFVYKSSDRTKESIKSCQNWYPPNTLCSYRFVGKSSEKVTVQLKILRNDFDEESVGYHKRNFTLNYCPGNEIAIYNGPSTNDTLAWSYCDIFHSDINNIQVPVSSTGNTLLVQYYSAKGSFNGQDFTYTISYKFVKKPQNATRRRPINFDGNKLISLKPVNFSVLNLTSMEDCNCDFSNRIGTFKSWFMVLVVLGVISFLGAILTIVVLLTKCMRLRSMKNKLLQTPKR